MLQLLTRIALVLVPASAWARYEDFAGDEDGPTRPPEWTLPIYFAGGMLLWAVIVWDQGWRRRAWPVGITIAAVLAAWMYGWEGFGFVSFVSFPLAIVANVDRGKKS